jgi:HSP20 family molecular chaperone IbpA
MTRNHPLETIAQRLEKALEAVENPILIPAVAKDVRNADISVEESDEAFTVKVDLTGVDPDMLDIAIWDGVLTLSTVQLEAEDEPGREEGEDTEDEANPDPENIENYGGLVYQVSLPANVDVAEVVAEFIEDRLVVQLPKLKTSLPISA